MFGAVLVGGKVACGRALALQLEWFVLKPFRVHLQEGLASLSELCGPIPPSSHRPHGTITTALLSIVLLQLPFEHHHFASTALLVSSFESHVGRKRLHPPMPSLQEQVKYALFIASSPVQTSIGMSHW